MLINIKENQKVLMITKSDDGVINLKQEGIIIKTPNGFGLKIEKGWSPIYSKVLNEWTYIGNDIKEKVICFK